MSANKELLGLTPGLAGDRTKARKGKGGKIMKMYVTKKEDAWWVSYDKEGQSPLLSMGDTLAPIRGAWADMVGVAAAACLGGGGYHQSPDGWGYDQDDQLVIAGGRKVSTYQFTDTVTEVTVSVDAQKIRRRIEDALRKKSDIATLLQVAAIVL